MEETWRWKVLLEEEGEEEEEEEKELHSFPHNISLLICDKDTLYSHSCVKYLDNIRFIFAMVNSCFSQDLLRRKIGIN